MRLNGVNRFVERHADRAIYLILIGWAAFMLALKFRLAHFGLATDDLYNYANALYNTNFWDNWLYVARYEAGRHLPSLMFDHWQPTTLLLWPLVHLSGPHSLLVVQALAPAWACLFLARICRYIGLSGFDRLFAVTICLFSPYMMLAAMDSIEGFHATSLLLVFGAPLAWAVLTRRWRMAFILMLLFLNVRENAALYILGAVLGYWIFKNRYFDNNRRTVLSLALAALVFFIGVKVAPMLAGVDNFHFSKVGHTVSTAAVLKFDFSQVDKDWAAYAIGLWPAALAPGAFMAVVPEALMLIAADKTIVNWYGMMLVMAGAAAAAFGLCRLRAWASSIAAQRALTIFLIAHMALLVTSSLSNVLGKHEIIIERYGFNVPERSLVAAREAIDPRCRTSVFFQAMKGFGDLPHLLYPHPIQVEQARFVIVSKRAELNLLHNRLQRDYAAANKASLEVLYEDAYLTVFKQASVACVNPASGDNSS